MSLRILIILVLSLSACNAQAGQETLVRGNLIWTDNKQTVTECGTGRVYWVRVLASNPHVLFTRKVDELVSKGVKNIIAEFRGEISTGMPSLGPTYPVDGTLTVHRVVSIESGSCE